MFFEMSTEVFDYARCKSLPAFQYFKKRNGGWIMARYDKPWYVVYRSMMSRCYNPNASNYKYYGARGIGVYEEWKNPDKFGEWALQSGFQKGLTIERVDVNGDYSPDNCVWATRKAQASNRRSCVRVTYKGETHNLSEWAKILGINRSTLINRRIKGKHPPELFSPVISLRGATWVIGKDGKRIWQSI